MSNTERFSGEGKVAGLRQSPARIKLDDGGRSVDVLMTSLDIVYDLRDKNKLVKVFYPSSTSIRPGDYVSVEGTRAFCEGFETYSGFAERMSVLDRGLFRNKRWIKQDYQHPAFSVESWSW